MMLASASSQRPIRGKFAQPPVKVACLPCRTSRTRCSGHYPCASCANKNRNCSYLPSKRGGPRRRGQKCFQVPDRLYRRADPHAISSEGGFNLQGDHIFEKAGRGFLLNETSTSRPTSAALGSPESPRNYGSSRDIKFENDLQLSYHVLDALPHLNSNTCVVRAYWHGEEILEDYYDIIHPYFPILPPKLSDNQDRTTHFPSFAWSETSSRGEISTPLTHAMRALLALYPCPGDLNPTSPESTCQRKNLAHAYAQEAEFIIDMEYKTQITAIAPAADSRYSTWAAQPSMVPTRQHPSIPEDLELLQALLVLSAYEYIQKGDFVKMKFRANQALALALQKGLHCHIDNDELSEARRRAWWMTHYSIIQSARLSYTSPTIPIDCPQFTTPYPLIDLEARICLESLRRNALLFDNKDLSDNYQE